MARFACKMCGGNLIIEENQSVCTCEYCGSKETVPRRYDERKANLYDRANHYRINNDFDKASALYELVLNEDKNDAEAYWSLVLCKYGITYVEDPQTKKRMLTVNRSQYLSVYNDENYKLALHHADAEQKVIYEQEAKILDSIQRQYLDISKTEKPYDVFICYKEQDENGNRTEDSVLAFELYNKLEKEGFKVFFARVTLRDKAGMAYEPYIFAALASAKVMLVIGTKKEYFYAPWVKNEWSRFLTMKNNGEDKTLKPLYAHMDAYDIPEEFGYIQATNMTDLGYEQDIILGIRKIVGKKEEPAPVHVSTSSSFGTMSEAYVNMVKRGNMALEDYDFEKADQFFENALNANPEGAEAYLGKLLVEVRQPRMSSLKNCKESFANSKNYRKVMKLADRRLHDELYAIEREVYKKSREERNKSLYMHGIAAMKVAKTENDYQKAIDYFKQVEDDGEAKKLIEECEELKQELIAKRQEEYNKKNYELGCEKQMKKEYYLAIEYFEKIIEYKDAPERIRACQIGAEYERKMAIYNDACAKMANGNYENAIIGFQKLPGFKDVDERIKTCKAGAENQRRLIEKAQIEGRKAAERKKAKEKAGAAVGKVWRFILSLIGIALETAFVLYIVLDFPDLYEDIGSFFTYAKYEILIDIQCGILGFILLASGCYFAGVYVGGISTILVAATCFFATFGALDSNHWFYKFICIWGALFVILVPTLVCGLAYDELTGKNKDNKKK